eukprot:4401796-Prymnesium_polylepis.2
MSPGILGDRGSAQRRYVTTGEHVVDPLRAGRRVAANFDPHLGLSVLFARHPGRPEGVPHAHSEQAQPADEA